MGTGTSDDTARARRRLSTKQLERTKISCPMCRAGSILGYRGNFDGQVFISASQLEDTKPASDDLDSKPVQESHVVGACDTLETVEGSSSASVQCAPVAAENEPGAMSANVAVDQVVTRFRFQIKKMYRAATTTLMHDFYMDSFLGGIVYQIMPQEIGEQMYMGGKTGKYVEKRRKLKLGVRAGVRLDGLAVNGGNIKITVGQVEDKEKEFGVLVLGMLDELGRIRPSFVAHCDSFVPITPGALRYQREALSLADSTLELLAQYLQRHLAREAELKSMVQHGVPLDGDRVDHSHLDICLPQAGGMTVFEICGMSTHTCGSKIAAEDLRKLEEAASEWE